MHRSLHNILVAAMIAGSAVISAPALAEYQDPIALPAIKMASAQYALTLDIAKAGDRLVSVGERGHVMISDDQGQSWNQAEVGTRMQLNALQFVSDQVGYAVGEDGVILQTTDAGSSWQLQFEDSQGEMKGPLLDLLFTDENNGFAVGTFNKFFRTTDGGKTWQNWQEHIDNLDEWHLIAMAATGENSDTIYIASEMGLLFRSTDGGEMFEQVQTDHDGSFHGILARRNADGVDELVLVGVGGMLWTTTDGGESWNQLDAQTEAGLAAATWLEDGSVAVVGADGIVLQLDASLQTVTKHQTDSGLPLSSVLPMGGSKLLMVGFGGFHRFDLAQ